MSGTRRPPGVARMMSERARGTEDGATAALGVGGILAGLGELAERLQKLTAEGGGAKAGPDGRLVFGWSVRVGEAEAQAFGHVPEPEAAPEARLPIVDVFEEAEALLVVAEVPGLDPAELRLSVEEGALVIEGGGARRYRRRVELPAAVDAARMSHACRNGILEVRLPRAGDAA